MDFIKKMASIITVGMAHAATSPPFILILRQDSSPASSMELIFCNIFIDSS